jgi:hypothetical protein
VCVCVCVRECVHVWRQRGPYNGQRGPYNGLAPVFWLSKPCVVTFCGLSQQGSVLGGCGASLAGSMGLVFLLATFCFHFDGLMMDFTVVCDAPMGCVFDPARR